MSDADKIIGDIARDIAARYVESRGDGYCVTAADAGYIDDNVYFESACQCGFGDVGYWSKRLRESVRDVFAEAGGES